MSILDGTDPRHAEARELLRTREIGWLATNGRNGHPHAVPVWFLWLEGEDGGDVVVTFSQPHAVKARNLREDARAAFQLETGEHGEHWLLLQGDAELSPESTGEWMLRVGDAYSEKYRAGLDNLGWPLERIIDDFSLAIVFRPTRVILG